LVTLCIALVTSLAACNGLLEPCEEIQEWKIEGYRVKKSKCPDLVLAHYYSYSVCIGDKAIGGAASPVDSCLFNWQATSERFVTFDVCNSVVIRDITPQKALLDKEGVDSIQMFSNEQKVRKTLDKQQIAKFVRDWNESKSRDYATKRFDSAFYPTYQYRFTVYYNSKQRTLYGYNYLVVDSSNWVYEMGRDGDLEYFKRFWAQP
jgi:hypothetical protein